MSGISAALVKELREITGAGMMDCKKALEETSGDLQQAIDALRKKGLKDVGKRSGKIAAEGAIYSYIHGGRVGVMVELNSETDFVARGDDFQEIAKRISMHIAWSSPKYVTRDEVPASELSREEDIIKSQLTPQQEKVADKIVSGKIEKFYEANCLIDQLDAQDESGKKKIGEVLNDYSAKVGEKIVLRRFVRFEVGEGIAKEEVNYADEVAAAAAAVN